MAVLIAGNHVSHGQVLCSGELLRSRSGTARLVIKPAFLFPQPCVIASARHTDKSQHITKWQVRSCTLNGPQQPSLPGSIGNTNSIEGEFGHFECHNHEMQKSQQSGDTTSQKENFSLEGLRYPYRVRQWRQHPPWFARASRELSIAAHHVERRGQGHRRSGSDDEVGDRTVFGFGCFQTYREWSRSQHLRESQIDFRLLAATSNRALNSRMLW